MLRGVKKKGNPEMDCEKGFFLFLSFAAAALPNNMAITTKKESLNLQRQYSTIHRYRYLYILYIPEIYNV